MEFNTVTSSTDLVEFLDFLQDRPEKFHAFLSDPQLFGSLIRKLKGEYHPFTQDRVTALCDDWIRQKRNSSTVFTTLPPSIELISNLGYLFPSWIVDNWERFKSKLRVFNYTHGCRFFLSARSIDLWLSDGSRLRDFISIASPQLIFSLIVCTATHAPNRESDLIKTIIEIPMNSSREFDLLRKYLKLRLSHLVRKPSSVAIGAERNGGKVAVIVAGQLRGAEISLPKIESYFNFPQVDFYISTWDSVGRVRFDRARMTRVLTPEAVEIATNFSDEHLLAIDSLLAEEHAEKFSDVELLIRECAPYIRQDHVHIERESHPIFQAMSIHEKMHFHNMYWPRRLGQNFFSSNYDYVVKIRPDLNLQVSNPLNLDDLRKLDGTVATESPKWKLSSWGFGAGDQILYGPSHIMETVLSTWQCHSEAGRLRVGLLGLPPMLGHSSIGFEIWLAGSGPSKMKFIHRGYAGEPRLGTKELLRLSNAVKTN